MFLDAYDVEFCYDLTKSNRGNFFFYIFVSNTSAKELSHKISEALEALDFAYGGYTPSPFRTGLIAPLFSFKNGQRNHRKSQMS